MDRELELAQACNYLPAPLQNLEQRRTLRCQMSFAHVRALSKTLAFAVAALISQLSLTNFTTLITVNRLALISRLIVVGEGNNDSIQANSHRPAILIT